MSVNELVVRFMASDERGVLMSELRRAFPSVPAADLEDTLSNAVLAALRASHADNPAALYKFLRSVARRDLIDLTRSSRERTRADSGDFDFDAHAGNLPTPEAALLEAEQARLAAEAMARLPRRRQAIVYHRLCDGEQRSAIAERLGLSAKTVKKQLECGVRDLRAAFASMAGEACTPAWQEQVAGHAFGMLAAEAELPVRGHIRACPDCRAYYSRLRSMSAAAAAAVPLPLVGGSRLGAAGRLADALRHPLRPLAHGRGRGHGMAPARGAAAGSATLSVASKLAIALATGGALAGGAYGARATLTPAPPSERGPEVARVSSPAAPPVPAHKPHRPSGTPKRAHASRRRHRHRRGSAATVTRPASSNPTVPTPAPTPMPAPSPPPKPQTKRSGGEFF